MKKATDKRKNIMAPGSDGINSEFLKAGEPAVVEELTTLFNKMWQEKRVQ